MYLCGVKLMSLKRVVWNVSMINGCLEGVYSNLYELLQYQKVNQLEKCVIFRSSRGRDDVGCRTEICEPLEKN